MNETCRKRSLPLRANNSNHFDVSHDTIQPKTALFREKRSGWEGARGQHGVGRAVLSSANPHLVLTYTVKIILVFNNYASCQANDFGREKS